jgi:hypothetical protein
MSVLSAKKLGSSDQSWSYSDLVQIISEIVAQGGGGGSSSSADLPLTGGTLSGPLAIATATQPELHIGDAAGGVQTLDINNNGLTLIDSSVGNSIRMTLAQILVQGSGAETVNDANRTTIGVNNISLGHKSWNNGLSPVQLYESNQGDLWVQFPASGQNYRLTDFANSRLICPTNSLSMTSPTPGNATVTLTLNDTGDIIATQQTGPNAGKSVNLTYGLWA